MNSNYEKKKHQLTGDTIWKINDIDLAITDGGSSIVKDFIDENKYDDYTLSIYDEITKNTIEITISAGQIKDGENLFRTAFKINPMFRFKSTSTEVTIILDTIKLDKHPIYYLTELLSQLKLD